MNGFQHRLRIGPLDQGNGFVVAYGGFVGANDERVTAIAPKGEWHDKVGITPGDLVLIGPDEGRGLANARAHLLLMLVEPPEALELPEPPAVEDPVMLHAVVMFPPPAG